MPVIVAWIVAGLGRMFATRLGAFVLQAMIFLGIQWAVQRGAVAPTLDKLQASLGGLPGAGLAWVRFFRIDQYCSIVLSAYGAGTAASGLKKLVLVKKT